MYSSLQSEILHRLPEPFCACLVVTHLKSTAYHLQKNHLGHRTCHTAMTGQKHAERSTLMTKSITRHPIILCIRYKAQVDYLTYSAPITFVLTSKVLNSAPFRYSVINRSNKNNNDASTTSKLASWLANNGTTGRKLKTICTKKIKEG